MPWLQLTFYTTKDDAEALSELLSETGAAAVTMQDAADQPLYEPPPGATPLWQLTNVVGLFDESFDVEALLSQLRKAWPQPLPDHRSELLEDQDWERAWMEDFKPMRFGEHLWIVPSWHEAPDAEGVNIHLDPGLAFGTGTHATTRLCLEWLDANPPRGQAVIDYGCGSGILGIAAALLGATSVLAVDNDPQALAATMENARRNGVEGHIRAYLPSEAPQDSAPLLIANILAGPLITLAPTLAARVQADGDLVLSGILPEQAEEVAAAYREWFAMAEPVELDGWIRLEGKRLASR